MFDVTSWSSLQRPLYFFLHFQEPQNHCAHPQQCYLVACTNPNPPPQYQCSPNYLLGILLEHCFYACITQLAYRNKIFGQCKNMQKTRKCSNPSTLLLQIYFSATNDSNLPVIPQEDITTILFLILAEPLSMGSEVNGCT